MRTILCSYAKSNGFETVEAVDGVDALAKLETEAAFDAAMIDWDMPRMNGFELLKIIRADPRFNEMKAMMVTAQSNQESLTAALSAGADDYLMKPLDEEMFADKLRVLGLIA
jgi:two-component system chemotaxis response regulator CheY